MEEPRKDLVTATKYGRIQKKRRILSNVLTNALEFEKINFSKLNVNVLNLIVMFWSWSSGE